LTFRISVHRLALVAGIALAGALYLADLTGMGLVGPDEPRYAAIGRAMAASGDWVTPRLWGQPWFDKPILLY
jgi:4-amino-4-deoxy-L-arabinose transferase-like glycosyltransferase